MNWKAVARELVPPLALRAARRVARRVARRLPSLRPGSRRASAPEWELMPDGFAAARRDPKIKGWNEVSVAQSGAGRAQQSRALLEAKIPVGLTDELSQTDFGALVQHNTAMNFAAVLGRLASQNETFSLLDWGGGLGSYFHLTRQMRPDLRLLYTNKEMPIFEAQARLLVPEGAFCSDDSALDATYDLIFASCSLHYTENWPALLLRFFEAARRGVYLARVPVVLEGQPFVFVQRPYAYGYQTEYLGWFLGRDELLQCAQGAGWRLEREFLTGETPRIQGAVGRYEFRSFLFLPPSHHADYTDRTDIMNPEFFSDKKCLITGGLGFIGSNLARVLVMAGARVTVVDSLIPEYGGNPFNIAGWQAEICDKNHLNINISDVRDEFSFRHLVKSQDYLFNLAGQTSHLDSMRDPFPDLDINCRAQLSILETCRHFNPEVKIVFASTRQLYGKPDYLPVDEKHLLRPVDVNGVNKMAGEWYHILYNNVYGLRACALRLTNTYGPRMRIKDARQTFLGIWVQKVLNKEPFEVWGGEQLRDFTYADDCVSALLLAAQHEAADGQIFNLGGQNVLSLRAMAQLVVEENGGGNFEIREFPAERKRIDIGDYYSDYSFIEATLGWKPLIDERTGVRRTLEFYRAHREHYL